MLLEDGNITVRRFCEDDIEDKVKWINDPQNNTYLHYDLPLEYDKTLAWYQRIKENTNRLDATIEYAGAKVGLIGLLGIDSVNKKAEYYVCLCGKEARGKGIATVASRLLLDYAFNVLGLNRIYLYTEEANTGAQRLFERVGFRKEGLLINDLIYNGRKVNRYVYGLLSDEYTKSGI